MPVVLKIDSRRKVVYSSFYGRVTGEELVNHRSTIAADPDFNWKLNEIVDFTDVIQLVISEETLQAMAGTQSLFSDSSLHIIVAPEDLEFQLASKFKLLAKQTRPGVRIVRTRSEAYQLLGRSAKQL
jgi:hypothetical protein